jgi:hypothetical protein
VPLAIGGFFLYSAYQGYKGLHEQNKVNEMVERWRPGFVPGEVKAKVPHII